MAAPCIPRLEWLSHSLSCEGCDTGPLRQVPPSDKSWATMRGTHQPQHKSRSVHSEDYPCESSARHKLPDITLVIWRETFILWFSREVCCRHPVIIPTPTLQDRGEWHKSTGLQRTGYICSLIWMITKAEWYLLPLRCVPWLSQSWFRYDLPSRSQCVQHGEKYIGAWPLSSILDLVAVRERRNSKTPNPKMLLWFWSFCGGASLFIYFFHPFLWN